MTMTMTNKPYAYKTEDMFRNVLEYNLGYVSTFSELMRQWWDNKSFIREAFNGETMVSKRLTVEDVKEQELVDSLDSFVQEVEDKIDNFNLGYLFRHFVRNSVMVEGFKDNRVMKKWTSEGLVENLEEHIDIPEGMKFSRTVRLFFDEEDEEIVRELQDLYSEYRQTYTNGGKGYLTLSIDPMDFITISDNDHNWSSCHNMSYGEYRIGNLNFMTDCTTLVAYFSDGKKDKNYDGIGDAEWNSKRWRMLVHLGVNEEGEFIVVYNKNYPYHSEELTREVDKYIVELFNSFLTKETEYTSYDCLSYGNGCVYTRSHDLACYIDIGHSNGCNVRIASEYLLDKEDDNYKDIRDCKPVSIGHPVKCLECGDSLTYRGDSGLCDSCADEWYCEDCDGYYSGNDMHYLDDEDRHVCYSCLDYHYVHCDGCGFYYSEEDEVSEEFLFFDSCVCDACARRSMDRSRDYVFVFNDTVKLIAENKVVNKQALAKPNKDIFEKIEKIADNKNFPIKVLSNFYVRDEDGTSTSERELADLIKVPYGNKHLYQTSVVDGSVNYPNSIERFLTNDSQMVPPKTIYLAGIFDSTIEPSVLNDFEEAVKRFNKEIDGDITLDTSAMLVI